MAARSPAHVAGTPLPSAHRNPAKRVSSSAPSGRLSRAMESADVTGGVPATLGTAASLLAARPRLARALRASRIQVNVSRDWISLLQDVENERVDVVVVDLDAVESPPEARTLAMSAYRLVTLLARAGKCNHFALIVQTARDFAEIEEVVLAGIHGLIGPRTSDAHMLAYIVRIVGRLRQHQRVCPGGEEARANVPSR